MPHYTHHTSSLTSVSAPIPAKRPIPSTTILRTTTTTVILRPPSSLFFPKPIASKTFSSPLRVAPPHKYVYPDPIPEFAIAETQKFRAEILKKLVKERETFGGDLDNVINVCAEILSEFLHEEYGGPGTLIVEPFTDMLIALKEKNLPGAPLAARASLLWAQNYVDHDWEIWNSKTPE